MNRALSLLAICITVFIMPIMAAQVYEDSFHIYDSIVYASHVPFKEYQSRAPVYPPADIAVINLNDLDNVKFLTTLYDEVSKKTTKAIVIIFPLIT